MAVIELGRRRHDHGGCLGTLIGALFGLAALPFGVWCFQFAGRLAVERDLFLSAPRLEPGKIPTEGQVVRITGVPRGEFPREPRVEAPVLIAKFQKRHFKKVTRQVRYRRSEGGYGYRTETKDEWVVVKSDEMKAREFQLGGVRIDGAHRDCQWLQGTLFEKSYFDQPARVPGAAGAPTGFSCREEVTGIRADRPVTVIGRVRGGVLRPDGEVGAVISGLVEDLTMEHLAGSYPYRILAIRVVAGLSLFFGVLWWRSWLPGRGTGSGKA